MGEYAFDGCTGLTNVTISNGVGSIGMYAFSDCSSLGRITIPGSVVSMGEFAFFGCSSLTNATLGSGAPGVGACAFYQCASLAGVTIPASATSIGTYAFYGCANLGGVTIPAGVSSIGAQAFSGCTGLGGVYFAGNAPVLGADVFLSDDNATVYYLPDTTGWSEFATNTGLTTVLWNPAIQTGGGGFGVETNYFGFNITNTANLTVVVEVCTNLAGQVWVPLATNTLVNGVFYFSEPLKGGRSGRFYGLGLP
jgi:hypothetical protein